MPASRHADKAPSRTALVLDTLIAADDFLSIGQIAVALGVPRGKLTSALHWLQSCGAIDAVQAAGEPFFFATPSEDRRTRTIDEHRVEDMPRRPRRNSPARRKGIVPER